MNLTGDLPNIEAQLWLVLLLSVRSAAALLAAPILGGISVPVQLRVLLGLAIGFLLSGTGVGGELPQMLSLGAGIALVHEVVIGIALGFVLQIAFAIPLIAAEQISGTMGLAIATSIDPSSGSQSGALGSYFSLTMMLLFFSLGAHLAWLDLVVQSYRVLPLGGAGLAPDNAREIVLFASRAFATAAAIALPVVLVLLLVQLLTGVLSRSAPSLNLFALGLPAGVLAGLAALIIVLPVLFEQFEEVIATGLEQTAEVATR